MKRLIIIVCVFAILASGCSGKKQSSDQSGGTNTVGDNNSQEPTKSGTAEQGPQAPSRVSKVVYSTREYTTNGTTSHYQIYMSPARTLCPCA